MESPSLGALSQLINVRFFGGHPNESISARCYREGVLQKNKKWLKRKDTIDKLLGSGHCYESHLTDINWAKDLLKTIEEVKNKVG